ncbi:uncharacterized protein N7479_008846 [Penicillium vulpinum]|uniref:Uncharacterized protein n=1 Tax=Penicillium vulpinum TaxID=29845 RepID=A0A1V6S275_9EURO|nr:uncharacterized protein N7479_008846 [Penicillium vulpinum]KAJ5950433.1 hypothetical protein N7479_008846 [Penicillium vulpinum]OQE07844.1 hypothetical protein PENVUL_c012G04982 [Penicillium vulpinum]
MQINRSSTITLALILAVTQSTTSHPIQSSKWVKAEQFQDLNVRGIWKVFEKGPYNLLPSPPPVKYNWNPAWPTKQNNEPTEQDTPNNRYTTGTSETGKPTISIMIPASPEIPGQIHNDYNQHTRENQGHHSSEDQESSVKPLATQKQSHYSKIIHYMHTKNALKNEHKHTTPASSSHPSSNHSISFFAYRFSFKPFRSKVMTFPQDPLPGVFTTVIILLVMVWVAIFTIGLLELGNYLWKRRAEAFARESDQVPDSEERDVGLDETMKVPLRIIIAPSERSRPRFVGEYGYEFLESIYSGDESDSGSESDEDDYRLF